MSKAALSWSGPKALEWLRGRAPLPVWLQVPSRALHLCLTQQASRAPEWPWTSRALHLCLTQQASRAPEWPWTSRALHLCLTQQASWAPEWPWRSSREQQKVYLPEQACATGQSWVAVASARTVRWSSGNSEHRWGAEPGPSAANKMSNPFRRRPESRRYPDVPQRHSLILLRTIRASGNR